MIHRANQDLALPMAVLERLSWHPGVVPELRALAQEAARALEQAAVQLGELEQGADFVPEGPVICSPNSALLPAER